MSLNETMGDYDYETVRPLNQFGLVFHQNPRCPRHI